MLAPSYITAEVTVFSVEREALPEDSLLKTYKGLVHPERWGHYADCFGITAPGNVDLAAFVYAFYTSPLFRIEALMLSTLLGASSGKAEARRLADGSCAKFAAWYVGQRTNTQLLMCDRYERTRSWFCVAPVEAGDGSGAGRGGTRLLFGSAIAAKRDRTGRGMPPRGAVRFLLRFHILYSKMLLRAARSNLPQA